MDKTRDIFEIAGVMRLTGDNSRISRENGFPVLELRTEKGWERIGIVEAKRAFPYELPDEFIVLEDENGGDKGFIRSLSERSAEEREILAAALELRYFMPKILHIEKVNDRFGFSYFKVETASGPIEFSVRDPYRSIMVLGRRMIVTDVDGNRYEIEDVDALPANERKRIEQYLW